MIWRGYDFNKHTSPFSTFYGISPQIQQPHQIQERFLEMQRMANNDGSNESAGIG